MSAVQTGQVSPDGLWAWDGVRWVAVHRAAPPAMMTGPRRSLLRTIGAVTAIAGAIVLTIGCAIPYVTFSGDASGGPSSSSIFNGGYPGAWGNIVEPTLVITLAIAGSAGVLLSKSRVVRALLAGGVTVAGAQTMAMFVGYITTVFPGGAPQLGAVIGPLGGLIILAGGAAMVASVATDR